MDLYVIEIIHIDILTYYIYLLIDLYNIIDLYILYKKYMHIIGIPEDFIETYQNLYKYII